MYRSYPRTLPFSNFDLWNNLETSGLLKAKADGLVLEYEIVRFTDSLWPEVRSWPAPAELHVPLDELESVTFHAGCVQTAVDLKAKTLRALCDVPGSKHGQIRLGVAEKDKARAKELASIVEVRLSARDLHNVRRRSAADQSPPST